jgi:toxin CcdB
LLLPQLAPIMTVRMNPIFQIDGTDYVLGTQFLSSVPARELGVVVTSLAAHALEITSAIDVVISGV